MCSEGATTEDGRDPFASYRAAWQRRAAEAAEADRRYRAGALEEARRAAQILAEQFGVERVTLFGSLAADRARRGSDVDLAVEGLAPALFFKADARLALDVGVPVDMKLLQDCPPLLQQRIAEDGIVLYER